MDARDTTTEATGNDLETADDRRRTDEVTDGDDPGRFDAGADSSGGGRRTLGRRSALKALGVAGLLGLGATTAVADSDATPQGQVGTEKRPLTALYAQQLRGVPDGSDPFDALVGGDRALRLERTDGDHAANVVLGHASNGVADGAMAAAIGGGGYGVDDGNRAYDHFATVGGGNANRAGSDDGDPTSARYATVAGGTDNAATATQSTVGGGGYNDAEGYASTVAGGSNNEAPAGQSTVGGGNLNRVYDGYGTVAGGYNNEAGTDDGDETDAEYATVAGGYRNGAEGAYATVGGGRTNDARDEHASVGGGYGNVAQGVNSRVGGGYSNYANDEGSTVGGGASNSARGEYATIAGGGPSDPEDAYTRNVVYDDYGTVGGGGGNVAGFNNSHIESTFATVAGGKDNHANGQFATIPGGENNEADDYAFAAGRNADANYPGSFVWADDHESTFSASGYDTWNARCRGGARFVTGLDGDDEPDAGVVLNSGGGSWSSLSASAAKRAVEPVDPEAVLEGVADLSIATWQYNSESGVDHMGPMAEQFHETFGLGPDDEHITSVDADGVALAAIQGLSRRLEERDERVDELESAVETRDERIDDLEARLSALEAGGGPAGPEAHG